MPFFLLGALSVGFTSCGDDDDDNNTPVATFAKIAYSVNGEENPNKVTLKRGTVNKNEGTVGEDDILKFKFESLDGSRIKKIQILVNNKFEINTPAVDELGNVYNDKFVYENPSTEKTVTLAGVYAKYTIKLTTELGTSKTITVDVENESGNKSYSDNVRFMSNKQTVILDANNKEYSNKFNKLTYYVKEAGGVTKMNFGFAELFNISETKYEDWTAGEHSQFKVDASELGFIKDLDINDNNVNYLVYRDGAVYYLIHILKRDKNVIKFEIQY